MSSLLWQTSVWRLLSSSVSWPHDLPTKSIITVYDNLATVSTSYKLFPSGTPVSEICFSSFSPSLLGSHSWSNIQYMLVCMPIHKPYTEHRLYSSACEMKYLHTCKNHVIHIFKDFFFHIYCTHTCLEGIMYVCMHKITKNWHTNLKITPFIMERSILKGIYASAKDKLCLIWVC